MITRETARAESLIRALTWILLIVGVFGGTYIMLSAVTNYNSRSIHGTDTFNEVSVTTDCTLSKRGLSTHGHKPIADVRVGDRVVAFNPTLSNEEHILPDPHPTTWRHVRLSLQDERGFAIDVELLRPMHWVAANEVYPSESLWLELPELGAAGHAQVLDVAHCPDIADGDGSVVIGTFEHTSAAVLNLTVDGIDEPIGTTAEHPFWSDDRQEFVTAGELTIGENLRTEDGQLLRLTGVIQRGPPANVYNIQVHGESVYYVSTAGLLVHNTKASAPIRGVDKSYKLKIHGTAQKTGTPGHQFRMYREAITEAKNPNVTSVHLDHGYNRALGFEPKTISPNRRPDVTSIYENNSVLRVEVQSKTDLPAVLRSRNSALDQQLIDQGFTPLPPRVVRPNSPSVNFRQ
ncbi:polymorphic toxin-type HINT domain-containing protein [Pirellulales bacterium]|nr:polymorphic toxin-type HINT domain-containing protein [Pirellulales bacterium]